MNAADYYKANVGLVHSVSRRGYARLVGASVGIDYDDVFQEMSVVFLKAYERFDASLGFQFSTLYFRSAYNRLNHWAANMIDERIKHGVISVNELDDNSDDSMEEVLYKDLETPENLLHAKQMIAEIDRTLSPLAKLILEWTIDPPDELLTELGKAQDHAAFGRSMGLNTFRMKALSPRYVANFIRMISDIPGAHAVKALKEIERLRLSQGNFDRED